MSAGQYLLIGKRLGHSFSAGYFNKKFKELGLDNDYRNYETDSLVNIRKITNQFPNLRGMNVTIPYKIEIMNYLDDIEEVAKEIGAVNVVKIDERGRWIGYNTDFYGVRGSLKGWIELNYDSKVLILGTGGAAKVVDYVLQKNFGLKQIEFVSRNGQNERIITYNQLNNKYIQQFDLIINTTPLGMYPDTEQFPTIPYNLLLGRQRLFDLIYNPLDTKFLQFGAKRGCSVLNGLKMLILQAETAWRIWNDVSESKY